MRASADRRKDDGLCHVTASEGASPPKWLSPERLRREFLKVSVASPRVDHRAALSFIPRRSQARVQPSHKGLLLLIISSPP